MTRTEDDLRSMYHKAATEEAEHRIVAWVQQQTPTQQVRQHHLARRWAAPVGAAVAVAAVTLTVVAVAPGAHVRSRPNAATRPNSAATSVSAPPSSTSSPHQSITPGGATVSLTAQLAQQTLLDLLPRKGAVSNRAGAADARQALTELTFDDGHGAAGIDLAITFPDAGASYAAWPCAEANHTGRCTTLPDGSQLFTLQAYEYPDRRVDTLDWSAAVLRPDGMQIQISEWNAPTEKDTPISRPAPPFTIAELTTVITSPAWTANVSAATAQKAAGLFTPDDRLTPPTGLPSGRPAAKPTR